jgi:hypothetical protein
MKNMPFDLVEEYIRASDELREAAAVHAALKMEVLKWHKRGYTSPLISVVEKSQSRPPWKELCLELADKYMTKAARVAWMKSVFKRYPPVPVAPSVSLAKAVKSRRPHEKQVYV